MAIKSSNAKPQKLKSFAVQERVYEKPVIKEVEYEKPDIIFFTAD